MIPFLKTPAGSTFILSIGIFWILALSLNSKVVAQDENDLQILIQRTDSLLGADDELVNGKIYMQKYMLAEGHPFFLTPQWQKGSVTVNGKKHTGLNLKYNIYTDELVLKAEKISGGASVISLNNEFIESFYLEDKHFVNSMGFNVRGIQTDFVELLYKGNFDFFVSYTKFFNNDYNDKTPYGSYGKTNTSYFLLQNKELVEVSSKKALFNYFELIKKKLKKYLKKNRIK